MLSSKTFRQTPWLSSLALREAQVSDVVRVKVVLTEIVPPTWRRLRVPVHMTLRHFHAVIQEAIGYRDLQPHRFRIRNVLFGKPSDSTDALKDSRWVTLRDIVSSGTNVFTYHYGPGGGWTYEILIESLEDGNLENQRPVCLDGQRAFPPEDSDGPDDYVDRVLRRPGFDPEHCDLVRINASLEALRRARRLP